MDHACCNGNHGVPVDRWQIDFAEAAALRFRACSPPGLWELVAEREFVSMQSFAPRSDNFAVRAKED